MAVRSQQRGGYVEFGACANDVVDPICPARNLKLAGLVEQQPATTVHQLIEATPREPHVPHPPTKQFVTLAEVVANPNRGLARTRCVVFREDLRALLFYLTEKV